MDKFDPPTLVCTEAGVFAWPGYALVRRHGVGFSRASEREIFHLIGALCGASAVYGLLIPTLDRAARSLERGEVEKARASIARLRLPPRSPEIEKIHLRAALDRSPPFAKLFNPDLHPRWPAGQSDGGQFRPVSETGNGERVRVPSRRTELAQQDRLAECIERCWRLLLRPKPYKSSDLNEFALRRCINECMSESS